MNADIAIAFSYIRVHRRQRRFGAGETARLGNGFRPLIGDYQLNVSYYDFINVKKNRKLVTKSEQKAKEALTAAFDTHWEQARRRERPRPLVTS